MLDNHKTQTCPNFQIACSFRKFGCKEMVSKPDVMKHLQMEIFDHYELAEISNLEELGKAVRLKVIRIKIPPNIGEINLRELGRILKIDYELLELDFNFCKWRDVDEDVFLRMGEILQELVLLRRLHLDLTGEKPFSFYQSWSQITDKGLNKFSANLSSLTQLEELDLNFSNWGMITDEGLLGLSRALNFMKKLSKLSINFSNLQNIKEDSVQCLITSLNSLERLSTVTLIFSGCTAIQQKTFDSFSTSFPSLRMKYDQDVQMTSKQFVK